MIGDLPQFVRDLLASPPHRGGGLNVWCYRVARVMHAFRSESEIIQALQAATAGEQVKPGEIERAVERSRATAWKPGQAPNEALPRAARPAVNPVSRAKIIAAKGGLVDLWEASPIRFDDNESRTEEIIDHLFPGDPLLCVGKSNREFVTQSREELRGALSALSLIVPSSMTARTGTTQDGKESAHTLASTGPRRHLVVEQDSGTEDEQSAVLLYLSRRAPLALAVHSGGKSIHGWFAAEGRSEDMLRAFFEFAVTLGADPALWTRSQFCRMPDGVRENGKKQTIFYFNPSAMK